MKKLAVLVILALVAIAARKLAQSPAALSENHVSAQLQQPIVGEGVKSEKTPKVTGPLHANESKAAVAVVAEKEQLQALNEQIDREERAVKDDHVHEQLALRGISEPDRARLFARVEHLTNLRFKKIELSFKLANQKIGVIQ